jgi:hypothetical protein
MALSYRIDALRAEVIGFIEDSRRIQFEALTKALKGKLPKSRIPPIALVALATSAALALNREAKLGVFTGHREVNALIERFLKEAEPKRAAEATSKPDKTAGKVARKPRVKTALTK